MEVKAGILVMQKEKMGRVEEVWERVVRGGEYYQST
jgi:hypothetical protein